MVVIWEADGQESGRLGDTVLSTHSHLWWGGLPPLPHKGPPERHVVCIEILPVYYALANLWIWRNEAI